MRVCGGVLLVIAVLGIAGFWKKRTFILLLSVSAACFAAAALNESASMGTSVSVIEKNESGEGSSQKELIARTSSGEELEIDVIVPEKQYTQAEAEEILEKEESRLDSVILGENSSFDEIRSNMVLPSSGENTAVSIAWQSSDISVISVSGEIQEGALEGGSPVTLSAVLTLQDYERNYEKEIVVYPKEPDSLAEEIQKELEAENEDAESEEYILPDSVSGVGLTWFEKPENSFAVIAFLMLVVGILMRLNERQKADEAKKKRGERLKRGYPEIVNRLLLMLYSGTTARGAFFKMASMYDKKKKSGGRPDEAFEEITVACRQMENGSSEDEAYERMALRCALPCYRKLCVLLVQNLKKGGKGFTDALEQEAIGAMADRKRAAEALGAAASLKLLVPLGMMLMVALAVMMIPAFLSL